MESKLKLIPDLTESRLFRTRQNQSKLNVDDAAELTFAYFMILNMFNKDYEFWFKINILQEIYSEINIFLSH